MAEPVPPREPGLRPLLLGLLTVAALLAPAVLEYQNLTHRPLSITAVVVTCIVLFVLVVIRMAMLLKQVQRQTVLLRELSLVDELTGLPNRRAWSTALPNALQRARRDGRRGRRG